ncbi:MAG TPA: MFS transporter [Saprospiraceae bacterium]|nr:MFS transporter [Saprospiraceae bacterium]HND88307.1 MFS transporter [Saprospiraceae bacterium]
MSNTYTDILDHPSTENNPNGIHTSRLFTAACLALTVTSMTFAIRAGMIGDLGRQFQLSDTQLGWITGMAFFGFPVATTLGGFFVDQVGMRRLMWVAFGSHLLGLLLTIFAGGFWTLFLSTFLIGFANGMVEAVCNPLVASMYPNNKTVMLNKFHVWFPGGIVIGALLAAGMRGAGLDWQWQVAIILLPALLYGWLFMGQRFPRTERVESGVSTADMFGAVVTPLFLFMAACMFFTANTELSTTQWIDKLLGHAGANALLILALVNGLMALGRYFGEPIIHKLSPAGVLLASSMFAALGIYLLRNTEGDALYLAAVVFAIGVCYFWPTMLGFVSEYIPKSGALGLSLMGGAGMFGNWAYQTFFIGPRLDAEKARLTVEGAAPEQIDLLAGRSVLGSINWLPIVLVLAFMGLWFWMKKERRR